jgi:predicted phosphodiesterase
MKLAIASDLHLEFGHIELKNEQSADVLVLAGDVCVARDMKEYVGFFEQVSSEFNKVIYIMGNHEHYNGDFATTRTIIKDSLSHLSNVHVLEKESLQTDDYTFVCGTMWTDMNCYSKTSMAMIGALMNDFRCVKNSNRYSYRKVPLYEKDSDGVYIKDDGGKMRQIGMKMKEEVSKFSPEDAYEDHKKFLEYLDHVLQNQSKLVVVTHHAPSALSTPPEFAHQYDMNGGYRSHLDYFVEEHPQIKLWMHGHMHDPVDYTIGSTRVVSNPRGYIGYEANASKFQLKYLEL